MEERQQTHLHDKGYKELYSNKEVFLDLLRNMLRLDWAQDITPDDLTMIDKSYVTNDYSELESDLVYRLRDGENETIVYVLLEFQSSVDYRMPMRLLNYIVEILREYMKEQHYSAGNTLVQIPVVFPIVLYNGEQPWKAKLSLRELTGCGEAYGDHVLNFRYSLLDINHQYTEEDLLSNDCISAIIMLLDQNVGVPELLKRLGEIVERFKSLGQGKNRQIISHWVKHSANQIIADGMVNILNADRKEVPVMVSNLSTAYERGMQKATLEGRQEERIKMIKALKKAGVAVEIIAQAAEMDPSKVRELLS